MQTDAHVLRFHHLYLFSYCQEGAKWFALFCKRFIRLPSYAVKILRGLKRPENLYLLGRKKHPEILMMQNWIQPQFLLLRVRSSPIAVCFLSSPRVKITQPWSSLKQLQLNPRAMVPSLEVWNAAGFVLSLVNNGSTSFDSLSLVVSWGSSVAGSKSGDEGQGCLTGHVQ